MRRFGRVFVVVAAVGAVMVAAGPAWAGRIVFFSEPGYHGARLEVRDVLPNFAELGGWNDRARSLVIESGVWEICRDAYFRNCRQFAAGTRFPELWGTGLDHAISSARELVPGPGGVWIAPGAPPPATIVLPSPSAPPGTVIPLGGAPAPVPVPESGSAGITWNTGPAAPSAPPPAQPPAPPPSGGGAGITWNQPAPARAAAFHGAPLSGCEQRVYDALGERTGQWPVPAFAGDGVEGVADWHGQIWHFRCAAQAINIWQ